MNDARPVLAAAEALYGTIAQAQAWPAAIDAIVDLVGGGHGFLHEQSASGVLVAHARVDEGHFARLNAPETRHLLEPLVRLITPGLSTRSHLIPDREFTRSACYNELVRPLHGFHSVHLHRPHPDACFTLTVCRPQHAEDFAPAEAAKLGALEPHLTTALALHRRLARAERWSDGLARVLDRLDGGVILLDRFARPVLLNVRAERIIAENDGLTWEASGLTAATPAATRRLTAAIWTAGARPHHASNGRASHLAAAPGEERMRLERPSRRPPLLVSVLPIGGLGLAPAGMTAPAVAVFITVPDAPGTIDREAVAEAFQLTRRESEVAVRLAVGFDLERIACELGIGLATVRFHLKHVLDKTHTHSQAALVALLRGFVAAR